jgi:hypothetical protein
VTFGRWWARQAPELDALSHPFGMLAILPGRTRAAEPSVLGSCSASSILLIALVCGVLLDVTMPALCVEVFTTGNFVLDHYIRVRTWSFIAPLLRRDGRHL